ncbi:MAG: hypothetical protein LC105_11835 [Chitinophagales bacterium]|nr:hypothetical protein [Chitinophagales bacterium]MCZ2394540.1 hypothetical protein [Chitinophagales bacterium]
MKANWRTILLKLTILFSFSGFIVLTTMSFQYGYPQFKSGYQIDINYNQGHLFINQEIVKDKIEEFFSDSTRLDASHLSQLEKYLQKHPHVKYANAYIDSKGKLHVRIEQINPIARALPKGGGSYYIDDQNLKIPLSNLYTAKVPLLTGNIPETYHQVEPISSSELKSLVTIIHKTQNDPYWSAQITQLIMNDSGDIQMLPRLGNQIITIGDTTDIQEKLKKLDLFYTQILLKSGWDKFKSIDIQYKNQIVCK